jgi:hypothetical protein
MNAFSSALAPLFALVLTTGARSASPLTPRQDETGPSSIGPNLGVRRDVLGDEAGQPGTDDSEVSQRKTPGKMRVFCTFPGDFEELPRQDSNLDKENQNLLCYRYTTGY